MEKTKEYFFNNNKSGYKTNEKWLSTHNNELYLTIINNSIRNDIPFKERVYLYINDLKDVPKCPNCGNYVNFIGTLKHGYNRYCSIDCLNKSKEHKEKIIRTNIKKHGCESHNQVDSVKQKKRSTLLTNYGVDNMMKSDVLKKRQADSLIKNHGVDNPMKINSIIIKRKAMVESGDEFNIRRMLNRIDDNILTYIKHDYNGNVHFSCKVCGNDFEINSNLLTSRLANNTTICTVCNKNKSFSEIQKSIEEFLTSLNIKFETKNRKILKGKEIDIYIPDNKLGIEIDGLFWHSSKFKDKNYHIAKTERCENLGIQLLHVFEDEWMFKNDIVKSIIKSKLNMSDTIVYGRNCNIREIDTKQCKDFLNENHLQGNVNSKVRLGLFHVDKLVSVMTFGKKRIVMGSIGTENNYEMLRFCNKLNHRIHGGADKIFKHFLKKYNPISVISFADRRYSQGYLYKKLGFRFLYNTKPNYYYILPGEVKKHYRFKFRKDVLVKDGFESNKSESKIMAERGYLRVYDCGSIKFEFISLILF